MVSTLFLSSQKSTRIITTFKKSKMNGPVCISNSFDYLLDKDNIELFNLKFNKITCMSIDYPSIVIITLDLPTNLKGKWIENGNPIKSILLEVYTSLHPYCNLYWFFLFSRAIQSSKFLLRKSSILRKQPIVMNLMKIAMLKDSRNNPFYFSCLCILCLCNSMTN